MSPIDLSYLGLTVAVVAIALVAGRTPERICAAIFAGATIATQVASQVTPNGHEGNVLLFIDGLMAVGFLALALKYGYLWIALLMGAMAGYFSIHAYYLAMSVPLDRTFAIASNLATGVALLSLAIGVWTSRRRADEEA
jgi:hypothetical protein